MRYFLVIALAFFSWTISVAQITTFPHNENFETFSNCIQDCGNACALSNGWNNPATDSTDWIVDNNGTLTPGTGPSANGGADHNPGIAGGKYLYIESSSCAGAIAYLETPLLDFTLSSNPYFTFWYHLYGGSMGTLHVDVSTDGGVTYSNDIAPSITSNNDAWQLANISLSVYGGQQIKVRLRGITGSGGASDMAIDDVTFYAVGQMDVAVTDIQSVDSVFCNYGTNELCIEITNNDTIALDSGILNVRINGALFNSPFPFTLAALPSGASANVCLGQVPLSAGDVVSATVSMPNGIDDSNSSNDSLAETIALQPLPIIDIISDTTVCPGDTIGLGGAPTGPNGSTYNWVSIGGVLSSNSNANPVASSSSVSQYFVTVTDTFGCSNIDSVLVSLHALPAVDAGPDVALCPTASHTFGGSPTSATGVNFQWFDPNNLPISTLTNPTLVVSTLGQYVVVVEDANTCQSSDTIIVTAPTNVMPNAGNDVNICENNSVQIGDSPNSAYAFYSWSPGTLLNDSTIANPIASVTSNTQFVLQVQDTFGCTLYDTINIGVYSLPSVDAGNNTTICSLDSIMLGGAPTSNTAISYHWSPSSLVMDSTGSNPMAYVPNDTIFFVTVTDANGCMAFDSIIVNTDSLPFIDAGQDLSLCYGDVTLIGGFPSGASGSVFHWSPGFLLNDSTISNPQYTVNSTQTFILEVTDTNGCHGYDSVTVNVNASSLLPPTQDTTVCPNDTFLLQSVYSAAFVTYSWSAPAYIANVNANPIQTSVSTTTQYIIAAADTFGCGYVDTVMVYAYQAPFADAGGNVFACSGDSVQLGGNPSGPIGASYSWSAGLLLTSDTTENPIAVALYDTLFILTVTDTNACVAYDTVNFVSYQLPFVDAGTNQIGCLGSPLIIGGSPAGDASSNYSWSPASGLNNSYQPNPTYLVTDTAQFVLTVVDTNGCISKDSLMIFAVELPIVDAGLDIEMCVGDSAQLGGNPVSTTATSFLWSPNNGTLSNDTLANPYTSATTNTTYVLAATDNNGCINYDTVSVQINALPGLAVSANSIPCHGDTIQVAAVANGNFLWTNNTYFSSLTDSAPMVLIGDTTTLMVQVTDTNGCFAYDSITINPYPVPIANAGPDLATCEGQSIQIQGVTATNFSWSPSASLTNYNSLNPIASPSISTDYVLMSTTGSGQCIAYDTMTLTVVSAPIFNLLDTIEYCANSSASIAPTSSQTLTYSWSTSSSISLQNPTDSALIFSASSAGYIYLQATDTLTNCFFIDSIYVDWNAIPVATISPVPAINCPGEPLQLEAFGGDSYQWYPALNLSNPLISNPVLTVAGDTTYHVIASISAGCSDTTSIFINAADPITANAGPDVEICQLDTIQLSATGGLTYEWVFDASLSSLNVANPNAYPAFTKTYTVIAFDQYGCQDQDQVNVIVNALPNVSAGVPKSVCINQSVQIGGNPTGPANATYNWSPSIGLDNVNASNPFASPQVGTRYYVTVTTNKGCQDSSNVFVTVNPVPVLALEIVPQTICRNDTTSISVTSGIKKYQWSPSSSILDSTLASIKVFPKLSTVYSVTATDINGCFNTLDVSVNVNQLPVIEPLSAKELCYGDSVQLEAYSSTAASYMWTPGSVVSDSTSNQVTAKPEDNINLILSVTDQNGCKNTAIQKLFVNPLPFADAGEDVSNCEMNSVYIGGNPTAETGDILTWEPSIYLDNPFVMNPLALTTERMTFVLTVQNENGCIAKDSVLVNSDCYAVIYAPNAFTPGNNGLNDVFKISYYRVVEPRLTIYNRLGQVVYETTDLDKGWDGVSTTTGTECMAGVYYWVLVYKSEDSKKLTKDGTVTILR